MNLLNDLKQAEQVLKQCRETPVFENAKMNFIVNLVTILEISARNQLHDCLDDRFLEGSFTVNVILHTVNDEFEKQIILRLIQLRNRIVHEGQIESLTEENVSVFYNVVKSIISKSNGQEYRKAT